MDDEEDLFEIAKNWARTAKVPSNDDKLEVHKNNLPSLFQRRAESWNCWILFLKLYGLYKVVTEEEPSPKGPRPSALEFFERPKWDAWKRISEEVGEDRGAARRRYIDTAKRLGWDGATASSSSSSSSAKARTTSTSHGMVVVSKISHEEFVSFLSLSLFLFVCVEYSVCVVQGR